MASFLRNPFIMMTGAVVAGGSFIIHQCMQEDGAKNQFLSHNSRSIFASTPNFTLPNRSAYSVDFQPSAVWNYNWDRRDPKSIEHPQRPTESEDDYKKRLKQATSTAVRHIILVRHGQYVSAPRSEDRVLTDLGHEQAHMTGKRLNEFGFPITRLVHSTMVRATETAKDILSELIITPPLVESCDLLCEGHPIRPEPAVPNYSPSDEEIREDGARIEAAFRHYFHRAPPDQQNDSYEVLVCHGNVIRYFICRALQLPPEAWLRFNLDHGSITWIALMPSGRVGLRFAGNCGYMPPDKITSY